MVIIHLKNMYGSRNLIPQKTDSSPYHDLKRICRIVKKGKCYQDSQNLNLRMQQI